MPGAAPIHSPIDHAFLIDRLALTLTVRWMPCYAKPAKLPTRREKVCSSLQRLVSVRSRAELIITHMPSMADANETHTQSVEKSIASLSLRLG
jgi:hypothetical protein